MFLTPLSLMKGDDEKQVNSKAKHFLEYFCLFCRGEFSPKYV